MARTLDPDAVMFINNMLCPEGYEYMTLSDMVYNMCNWLSEGIPVPETVTPEEMMLAWNCMVDAMNRYNDLDMSDDSDEI